jgi:hypothetical protein
MRHAHRTRSGTQRQRLDAILLQDRFRLFQQSGFQGTVVIATLFGQDCLLSNPYPRRDVYAGNISIDSRLRLLYGKFPTETSGGSNASVPVWI